MTSTAAAETASEIPNDGPAPPRLLTFLKSRGTKLWKSALGAGLLGWGAYHAYVAIFVVRSTTAYIGGPISTVSAPIDGVLHHQVAQPGALLSDKAHLARVINSRIDRSRANRMEVLAKSLEEDIAVLTLQKQGLERLGTRFEARGLLFLDKRREQLEIEVSQARAHVEAERSKAVVAGSDYARQQSLQEMGASSVHQLELARSLQAVSEQALRVAEKDLERKLGLLESTDAGFTLDVSTSDRSYSSQRADEVTLRLAELSAQISQKNVERGALEAELFAERAQLNLRSEAVLNVPGVRKIWEVLADDGEFVHAGRPIFTWIDCKKLHVIAQVSDDDYEHLRVGTRASIQVLGADLDYPGVVSLLIGQQEHEMIPERKSAGGGAAPGFAVVVSSTALSKSLGKTCHTGQSVEIRFFP